jgi:MinD superfamily P-loop ATPase
MKIAVLSGKGGTGKTTLSVNIFSQLKKGVLLDTDVEEPNSHIFLDLDPIEHIDVMKGYPVIDEGTCNLCGVCGEICQFNAILPAKKKVMVFADLCHDCGGCKMVCQSNAISYHQKSMGIITHSQTKDKKDFYSGKLNVGEISGVKIIEAIKDIDLGTHNQIIDSPPGTSCSTVSSVEHVDYAIVVSEPTPFGVSDMKMVVEMLRSMDIKFGVVVNKAGLGNNEIYKYLEEENIELLEDIKFDKKYAKHYAKGHIISNEDEYYKSKIQNIIRKVFGEEYVN